MMGVPFYIKCYMKNTRKKTDKKIIWSLFVTFFKIGAFTFGGGYAMIPLIQRETVEKNKWISEEDILEIVAIAESTPGPIAINAATFVGYRIAGFLGAATATFGVVLPSFLIISLISLVLEKFSSLKPVKYAFWGIRAGVLALIAKALIMMFKKCKKDLPAYIVMALSFICAAVLQIDVIFVIIGCALFGLIWSVAVRRTEK